MAEREDPGPGIYTRNGLPPDVDQQLAVALQAECTRLCSTDRGILIEPVLVALGTVASAFLSQVPNPPVELERWVTVVWELTLRQAEADRLKRTTN